MAHRLRVRTVLYNDQRLKPLELDLIHTPMFQRLYDLKQLGLTDRVFVDASHSRLHHVIGVMQQVDNIMSSLARNLMKDGERTIPYTSGDVELDYPCHRLAIYVSDRKPAARLIGLLHDLTHAPFGHTLEDEIRLVDQKHDEPARQADAFYRLLVQYLGWRSLDIDGSDWGGPREGGAGPGKQKRRLWDYLAAPHMQDPPQDSPFIKHLIRIGCRLLDESKPCGSSLWASDSGRQRDAFRDLAFAMRATLHLEILHTDTPKLRLVPKEEYAFDRLLGGILAGANYQLTDDQQFTPHRDAFLLDAIGNTICADLLDYAKRDSFFAGMKLDYDSDRIVENFTLVDHWNDNCQISETQNGKRVDARHPFEGRSLRTAISVFSHKLRIDVPGELLNLLQIRFYVYERMLFHPTKCIAGAMLGAALQLIGWKRLPPHMRFLGDAVFLHEITESARIVGDLVCENAKPGDAYDQDLATSLKKMLPSSLKLGVIASARQLLSDRLVSTKEVVTQLDTFERLARVGPIESANAAAKALRRAVGEQIDGMYDAKFVASLLERLKQEEACVEEAAHSLALSFLPSVGRTLDNLRAGLRLLNRLSARRYHRSIFRLLPNVKVGSLNGLNATMIAPLFLNASTRMVTEREIERRADLPIGCIAIHCPVAEGPRKIANILMTDGLRETDAVRLREISKLADHIFGKHEAAITSLEEMYMSMWRLVVSVAPPHDSKWNDINKHIGQVLYEVLSSGSTGYSVDNDEYMVRELEGRDRNDGLEESLAHVELPGRPDDHVPVELYDFMVGLVDNCRESGHFTGILRDGRAAASAACQKDGPESMAANLEIHRRILTLAVKPYEKRQKGVPGAGKLRTKRSTQDSDQQTLPGIKEDPANPTPSS